MKFQKLFEPIRLGKVEIRNRIAMAPMVTQYADRGCVSEQQVAYYAARARGGVGLVIVERGLIELVFGHFGFLGRPAAGPAARIKVGCQIRLPA